MDPNDIKPSEPADINASKTTTAELPTSTTEAPAPKANRLQKLGSKKLFGRLGIVPAAAIVAVVLFTGSAAGYFGFIVPNKPENVLKTAIEKTALQKKTKFDGKFTYESTDPEAEIKAVNVTFNGQSDAEKNAFQTAFNVTASGVSLPFEVRSVEKSLFFKVGDLGTIKSLAMATAPAYGAIFDEVSKKLSNQWIEVDETLLKQANADCALNTSLSLTSEDIVILQNRYQEIPFTTVKSTSSDTVNGRGAYKYEIEIDDNKGAEYLKGLEELSVVKKLKECNDEVDTLDTEELADDDITPITLWVDKDTKTFSKLIMNSTKQDEEKSNLKGSLEITFQFGEAEVTKPDNAKPAMEIFSELQALLFGQFSAGSGLEQSGFDTETLGDFDFDF